MEGDWSICVLWVAELTQNRYRQKRVPVVQDELWMCPRLAHRWQVQERVRCGLPVSVATRATVST